MSEAVKENPLRVKPVGKLLREFTVPAIISMVVTAVYNIVDQIFIGQGIGPEANASTTVAFPLTMIVLSLSLLFGVGLGIYIATKFGEGREDLADEALQNVFGILLIIAAVLIVSGLIFIRPIVTFFGATESIMEYSITYTSIILCGSWFNMMTIAMDKVLRSNGAPGFAMFGIVIGSVLNTILDPIFIFIFHWGVAGAAIATIFSQFVSAVLMIGYLQRKCPLKIRLNRIFHLNFRLLKNIAYLGLSSFIIQVGGLAVQIIMNRQLVKYGDLTPEVGGVIALAAMGIIMKLYMIIISVCIGFSIGGQPIISFNNGSKLYHRVKEAVMKSMLLSSLVTGIGWLIVELAPGMIISIFDSHKGVFYQFGIHAMRIFLAMAFSVGAQIVAVGYFQATGQPLKASFLSLLRQILVLLPAILILPLFFGLDGILMSGPLSEIISSVFTFVLFRSEMKKLNRNIREQDASMEEKMTNEAI